MPGVVEELKENIGDTLAVQRLLVQSHEDFGMTYDQATRYIKGGASGAMDYLLDRMLGPNAEEYIIREDLAIVAFASLRNWNDADRGLHVRKRNHLRLITSGTETGQHETSPYDMAKWFSVASYAEDFDSTATLLLKTLGERSRQRGKTSLRVRVDAADEQMLDFFERTARPLDRQLGEVTLNGVTRGYLMYEAVPLEPLVDDV